MLSSSDSLPESFESILLTGTDLDSTLQTINLTTDFVSQQSGRLLDLSRDVQAAIASF